MIIKFQNKDNQLIGINPEQVVSVDQCDDGDLLATIHLANGQQRVVSCSVEETIKRLNASPRTTGYGGSVAV